MKRLLMISQTLSWINLVFWGFVSVLGVVSALNPINTKALVVVFILSGIPLHAYATLKLGKSLKNTAVPLGNQTPVGIRLMGALTLFMGLMMVSQGITIIQHFNDVVKLAQDVITQSPIDALKKLNSEHFVFGLIIAVIALGLFCTVNAVISFQMLRSYLLAKDSEKQDSQK